jgi:hypothetical protein
MARKIAYRGTFRDVLIRKPRRTPDRWRDHDLQWSEVARTQYLAGVLQDCQTTPGRTLFLGVGLVVGTIGTKQDQSAKLAAPVVMIPIEISPPAIPGEPWEMEERWSAATLNHDLISALVGSASVMDPEEVVSLPNTLSPAVGQAMEAAEQRIVSLSQSPGRSQRFRDPAVVDELTDILGAGLGVVRAARRLQSFQLADLPRLVTGSTLSWINHRFLFMGTMPDALSAYEALDRLCAQRRTAGS